MKTLFIIVSLFAFQFASAKTPCQPEAQIIAQFGERLPGSPFECRMSIDVKSIVQYNVNQLCPLDLADVIETGISVTLVDGHDCPVLPGDVVTGVLVQKPWGTITID